MPMLMGVIICLSPGFCSGGGYGMPHGGLRRASETTLLARAQSMSEAAGFQAPPELINAMELLAGEAPYPVSADPLTGESSTCGFLQCVSSSYMTPAMRSCVWGIAAREEPAWCGWDARLCIACASSHADTRLKVDDADVKLQSKHVPSMVKPLQFICEGRRRVIISYSCHMLVVPAGSCSAPLPLQVSAHDDTGAFPIWPNIQL